MTDPELPTHNAPPDGFFQPGRASGSPPQRHDSGGNSPFGRAPATTKRRPAFRPATARISAFPKIDIKALRRQDRRRAARSPHRPRAGRHCTSRRPCNGPPPTQNRMLRVAKKVRPQPAARGPSVWEGFAVFVESFLSVTLYTPAVTRALSSPSGAFQSSVTS